MGVPRKKLRRAEKIEQARSLGHYPVRNLTPLGEGRQRPGILGPGMLRAIDRLEHKRWCNSEDDNERKRRAEERERMAAAAAEAPKPKRARKPKKAAPQPAA